MRQLETTQPLEIPLVDLDQSTAADPQAKNIVIDWTRTYDVLGKLMDAYENKDFPYNQDSVRVPQDPRHMPENLVRGGSEHAMFLWSTCYYMRGGIKSVDSFKILSKVYQDRPDIFDASQAASLDPIEVGKFIRSYGLGYQHLQIGNFWVENAKRLQDRWQGDPKNIFNGVTSYEESLDRIKNDGKGGGFLGFQEKMVSMITYYLMDEDLIEPYVFPLPVDLHVMRIAVANELIKFEGYDESENVLSDQALNTARELFYNYSLKRGVNPLRLCDAVWLLSQSLCGKQPGNITLEPAGRANRNGRQTVLEALPVDITDHKQQQAYHKTCESCPLNAETATCEWNIPSKIYYVQGELKRRGRRVQFPSSRLFKYSEA